MQTRTDQAPAARVEMTLSGWRQRRQEPVEAPHPEKALLLGPIRVLPQELPHLTARLVDLPRTVRAEDGAAALCAELATPGTDRWLALRPPLRPDSVPCSALAGYYCK